MTSEPEYVGFWPRVGACLIDTLMLLCAIVPLAVVFVGPSYWLDTRLLPGPDRLLLEWLLPFVVIFGFWVWKQATPGKMVISARIVDAQTGGPPSTAQLIIRYVGYYVSTLPLGLGLIWVGMDRRKQGWHDKMARTIVVRVHKSDTFQPPEP